MPKRNGFRIELGQPVLGEGKENSGGKVRKEKKKWVLVNVKKITCFGSQ